MRLFSGSEGYRSATDYPEFTLIQALQTEVARLQNNPKGVWVIQDIENKRIADVFCYSVKSIYTVFTNSALIHFIQIFGSADDTVVGVVSMPLKFCFNSFTIHPLKNLFCFERNFIFSNVLREHFRVAMTAFCFQELFGFKGRPNMFSFCC